jgi:hypothetical protein
MNLKMPSMDAVIGTLFIAHSGHMTFAQFSRFYHDGWPDHINTIASSDVKTAL